MRTERVVLFGTHFFCVLEWARFLHTWALGKMLCYPYISALILQCQKGTNKQVRIALVVL